MHNYQKAALGGTFDRLHVGHEQLLRTALERAEHIIVGVTSDALVTEKTLSHLIEPFPVRYQAVKSWLANHASVDRYEVIQLHDIYGPTLFNPTINAVVVTSQTRSGGDAVNTKRQELELSPLPIIEAEMIQDEDNNYVSSTRIRQGEINRQGKIYANLFRRDITFTQRQLHQLREIQGHILHENDIHPEFLKHYTAVSVVGDVVYATFAQSHLSFDYAIIDGKTKRSTSLNLPKKFHSLVNPNPPGSITASIAEEILNQIHKNIPESIYMVSGEEDLLAFIPLLTLPLKSVVFYGQPDVGIVMIEVNEATKTHYAKYLDPSFAS